MDALASLVDRGSYSKLPAVPDTRLDWAMLIAWLVLQLAGQVTLPILIGTMLFHKQITRRNPTIINLCIVWTLATIPPELLLYVGKINEPRPNPMLCLFQAATVSAIPPMAAMAYLSVVVHACTVVSSIINANAIQPVSLDIRLILLLGSPYVTFLTFALVIAIVGAQNPTDVVRNPFFCEVRKHHLSLPVLGFTLIVVAITLISQIWIAIMFYRNWQAKRKGNVTVRDLSTLDIGLLIRMVSFTVFEVVIVVSAVATMMDPRMAAAKLLAATPPFAVFLIFSSSPDIFHAWFPCSYRRKPTLPLADQGSSQLVSTKLEYDNGVVPSPMAPVIVRQGHPIPDIDLEKGTGPHHLDSDLDTTMTFVATSFDPDPIRAIRAPAGPRAMPSSIARI